ncbi:MAG: YeeE/YedE thiosulfate transporter family protein [Bacteroidota bacterium]|nr:YeeE/YedE thiosulfate transporter family protein [Bacteroidota bacterium]
MIEIIKEPWPWYTSGVAIAGIMTAMLFFGKTFGFSSNFSVICAACGAGKKIKIFNFDWKAQSWNLLFLIGSVAGGFIAHQFLSANEPVQIAKETIHDISKLGFDAPKGLQPEELFGLESLYNIKNMILLILGGLFIGFGTRWAGGCTSGHAISGLSDLQLPSLIAVIGFFIGGLIMTHLLFPIIF